MLNVGDFTGPLDQDVVEAVILADVMEPWPLYQRLLAANAIADTMSPRFDWYTDSLGARRTAINNGPDNYDEDTTSIVVDDGSIFYPNCLILAEATGEIMHCTAVSTNTLTVTRGVGTTNAAASVADDANLTLVGSAEGEGQDAPTARMSGPTQVSNQVQIFRKTVELSGTMVRTGTMTEAERARQRMKKFRELGKDIEHAFIHGADSSNKTDKDGKPLRTTAGMLHAITTYVDNVAGTMSEARFYQTCEQFFAEGSTRKTLFAGGTLVCTLQTIFAGKLRTASSENAVGLNLQLLTTTYGELELVHHRGLAGAFAGHGIAVDLEAVRIRPMQNGGRVALKADIQPNDNDGKKDEWFGELGLEYGSESSHAVIKGVTGAA